MVLGVSQISVPAEAAGPSPAAAADRRPAPKPLTPATGAPKNIHKPPVTPAFHPQPASWPTGSADVQLDPAAKASTATRAGNLPVWLSAAKSSRAGSAPPRTVRVQVADQPAAAAAGINGVLLSVRPSVAGTAHVRLSYAAFGDAFGGDWDSRLRLVALPACALSTPAVPACRVQTPVPSTNDTGARTLDADVSLTSATVLAATSGTGGGGGDFTATSLKAAGTWQAGGNGDAFDWNYPIAVPSVPGDLVPKVALAYDSQSQDGLTSSTNNQASWIGDGWEYSPGFVERSYQSCHENPAGATRTWDKCWSSDNTLTLSLDGSSTALIKDDGTGVYHPKNDDNEKVEYLTGADNGAQGGEYWRVTTPDGIQYYFGQNKLPGWSSTKPATNSVWTEPVFATSSSQPCYHSAFADSWCQQAYRWNLDYVVDPHQDTIAYFYTAETNNYARDLGATANTPYVRGGYLNRIQYGQRAGQVYSTSPAAQVIFKSYGRCDSSSSGCDPSTLSATTKAHWPDVPYDENCADKSSCSVQSPTFWSTVMLTDIQTQALVGSAETNVDSWSLSHSFPATGDSTTASLWLNSIVHTGQDTTALGSTAPISLPAVTFAGRPLSNRVNVTNGYPPITRHRMDTITTESGEVISVNYSAAVCTSCTPADPAQNDTLAYPVYWTPDGHTEPIRDWFNKYVVRAVTEQDPDGGPANDTIATTYTPVGTPAWHYNENPLTPSDERTWDEWRGYSGMTVSIGTAPDPVSKTTYTYLRGMDGDRLTSTTKRSVSVTDSRHDPAIADLNQYAGATYETVVFNGDAVVTDAIVDPWTSSATATQASSGLYAYHTDSAKTRTYAPLASGDTRETETDKTHDSYGRVTAVNDRGDVATTADDRCTTTSFADNTTTWILDTPADTRTVSVDCAATPSVPGDVVSDAQSYYDTSTTLGAAPTAGDTTMVKTVKSYSGSTPNYVTVVTAVDAYGRPTSVTDGELHTTTTAYTPATGAAPTSVTVTDPLKFATTTTYDSLRNLPESSTDPAGYVTSRQYDALGRITAGYEPGRAAPSSPNVKYTYSVSNTGPSVVSTFTLNHNASGYRQSETLYDSLLRARETQAQTAGTGRTQTDIAYNTDGWQSEVTDPYYNAAPIDAVIAPAQAGEVDSTTGYLYDRAGRKTAAIAYALGTETWRTTYAYGGNFVTATPPAGGTATTTVTDARGNTVALRQYHAGVTPDYLHAVTGTFDDTTYTYAPNDKPATQHDPAGDAWSWSYDLLGNQTDVHDPDTGHAVSTYDNAGRVVSVTDAQSRQTTTTYDADGRKTALYNTSATQVLSAANKLADWGYDTVKKGLPASVTSYSGGDTFTSTTLAYNIYGDAAARKITLTGTDAALVPAGGYTFSFGYNLNGTPSGETDPASGGLPTENVGYGYDAIDEVTSLTSTGGASVGYVTAVGYNNYGQPLKYTLNAGPVEGAAVLSYDQQTRVLTGVDVSGFGSAHDIDNTTYTFGNNTVSKGAGLLTRIVDKQDGGSLTDTQCFTYDYAKRVQQAWTATDACAATPVPGNSSTVGGAVAPYWQSWTYDAAGDRQTQVDHNTAGVVSTDTTTTYHYPQAGSSTDQPHTLSSTTASGADAAAHTATYGYDNTGDTTTVTGGVRGNQTMTWDASGKLASDITASGVSSYAYDADGNQIIQRTPAATTLFVGDEQIVYNNVSKSLSGSRYYTINNTTIAVRTSSGTVSYLVPDRQNTNDVTINAVNGAVTRRQYLPFGETRSTATNAWPGEKGFVGGVADPNSGLEVLGAREYAPEVGRFISADPIFESDDPSQTGGYDYAGNNPVTFSDPTGKRTDYFDPVTTTAFASGKTSLGSSSGSGSSKSKPSSKAESEAKARIALDKAKVAALWAMYYHYRIQVLNAMMALGLPKFEGGDKIANELKDVQQQYLAKANEMRDDFIDWLDASKESGAISGRQYNRVSVVTAAWDPDTGKTWVGWKVNGQGAHDGSHGPDGWCAEDDCAIQAAADGFDPKKIQFTQAIRPRTGQAIDVCVDCQRDFDESQVSVSGAGAAPGGAWSQRLQAQAQAEGEALAEDEIGSFEGE